jgi:DNA-directed RNA polymerase subunit RPC12/RpoP
MSSSNDPAVKKYAYRCSRCDSLIEREGFGEPAQWIRVGHATPHNGWCNNWLALVGETSGEEKLASKAIVCIYECWTCGTLFEVETRAEMLPPVAQSAVHVTPEGKECRCFGGLRGYREW